MSVTEAMLERAMRERREALDDLEKLRAALVEVVASLVPTYDPAHPEDHGFSPTTAAAIRWAQRHEKKETK